MEKMIKYTLIEGEMANSESESWVGEIGEFIKHEDHLAALREIFPDWPGMYPTEDGYYYLCDSDGNVEIEKVYMVDGVACIYDGSSRLSTWYEQHQCGPRVQMWRRVP